MTSRWMRRGFEWGGRKRVGGDLEYVRLNGWSAGCEVSVWSWKIWMAKGEWRFGGGGESGTQVRLWPRR